LFKYGKEMKWKQYYLKSVTGLPYLFLYF
jgi:hypothetical protein